MNLFLHTNDSDSELLAKYSNAFSSAEELYIVSAYLTDWNSELPINKKWKKFRLIIGRDFGITRIKACRAVLNWLPKKQQGKFLVAEGIRGFHPKAVFWKESSERCYAIIGSSNLTLAAFNSNFEANVLTEISQTEYEAAQQWIQRIEKYSLPVSEDWLATYEEAPVRTKGSGSKKRKKVTVTDIHEASFSFGLPKPKGMQAKISERREQLAEHEKVRKGLLALFKKCAQGKINSNQFHEQLPKFWGHAVGNRLQGWGYEVSGRHSNFTELCRSFLKVFNSPEDVRDDVVVEEIDRLCDLAVPTRGSLFSEMLCLTFPDSYPLINAPVKRYLAHIKLRPPRGVSEGVRYVDLARKLRFALNQNPSHPAKNLAELDTVIWLAYGKKKDE